MHFRQNCISRLNFCLLSSSGPRIVRGGTRRNLVEISSEVRHFSYSLTTTSVSGLEFDSQWRLKTLCNSRNCLDDLSRDSTALNSPVCRRPSSVSTTAQRSV